MVCFVYYYKSQDEKQQQKKQTFNQNKHNRTQARLQESSVAASEEGQKHSATKNTLVELTQRVKHAEQQAVISRDQAQAEAETAKDLRDTLDDSIRKLERANRQITLLEKRLVLAEQEADANLLNGGIDQVRKGLIEESKKKTLESALDPETAKPISLATWNIAAVNNNPFEYWISGTDEYNNLMNGFAEFITTPGDRDIPVSKVFTPQMWTDLRLTMEDIGWSGVDQVATMWETDFKDRNIISEFLKDKSIGKKRLASMPDRYTNTISTTTGIVTRPTVINCHEGNLQTMTMWWDSWKHFMFKQEIEVKSGKRIKKQLVSDLLKRIKHSKYPSISEAEEAISIPLQTLAAAIFDSILVHIMNVLLPGKWETLRSEMCSKLNKFKNRRVVEILETQYGDLDVVFLQEVSTDFEKAAKKSSLVDLYDIIVPETADHARNQNSLILLKKDEFHNVEEQTDRVNSLLDEKTPVAPGDLVVLSAVRKSGVPFILGSFHGDTDGLATIPVVSAMHKFCKEFDSHKLLFGMDANTYENPLGSSQQGISEFASFYRSKSLTSCYGDYPNPKNYTTFHARTHLQPQLNKAVSLKERDVKGDKNPKDHVIFFKQDFITISTTKDNTGDGVYTEGMVFPTLVFPSDHGITKTVMKIPSKKDIVVRRNNDLKREYLSELNDVIKVSTWNIAAVNNNPFEYWISGTESYNKLMNDVAEFVTSPGDRDVKLSTVFTPEMWSELKRLMTDKAGWNIDRIEKVETIWVSDYQNRKIISGFLTDSTIGSKRLASMPDRYTNTITTENSTKMRPTVINCYNGDLQSTALWWQAWKGFMFEEKHYTLLKKIKHSKYPAISEEEEDISIPLQTLAAALFDSILVYMMNSVSGSTWMELRTEMCNKLNNHKNDRVVQILSSEPYVSHDILFLQETSSDFERIFNSSSELREFTLHTSESADRGRNQNSIIALKKTMFFNITEIPTSSILKSLGKVPVAPGDLILLQGNCKGGIPHLFASFHGDTNGLATVPVVKAIKQYADQQDISHLVFGLDANSHSKPSKKGDTLTVAQFGSELASAGIGSSYGSILDARNFTTFHARTHLQPQLNKGVFLADRDIKGDKNPKDNILFIPKRFSSLATVKDNTGKAEYIENMVFPTLEFPSDHGITSTTLQYKTQRVEQMISASNEIQAATWNVAAVNNNPFEYWIDGSDSYNSLMIGVSEAITAPSPDVDRPVKKVFTQAMWDELKIELQNTNPPIDSSDLEDVDKIWSSDYSERRVISDFLSDSSIGKKRLASIPDRYTNTILTADGDVVLRPTVINCFVGDLSTRKKWFTAWKAFMFRDKINIKNSKGEITSKVPFKMLSRINRSKYPAVTEKEEQISIPLQVLAAAIFDSVLVHLLNTISPSWQTIRDDMCYGLNTNKDRTIARIIDTQYYQTDVLFLQEVGNKLVQEELLYSNFDVHIPLKFDSIHGQNSVILTRKHNWKTPTDVTDSIMGLLDVKAPVVDGDLFVVDVERNDGKKFILASFHGDTNGLATIPVVAAIHKYVTETATEHTLLFGMDANSYEKGTPDQTLGVTEFSSFYVSKGLTTSYGDHPDPKNYTTFHARTHLQPQLNKAVLLADRDLKGDKNPKDNIMFLSSQLELIQTIKDNTGKGNYKEQMVFPTLQFPSDHGITYMRVRERVLISNTTVTDDVIKKPSLEQDKSNQTVGDAT